VGHSTSSAGSRGHVSPQLQQVAVIVSFSLLSAFLKNFKAVDEAFKVGAGNEGFERQKMLVTLNTGAGLA
jgi:hypothetical protein